MTFSWLLPLSMIFSYLPVTSVSPCIYTVPISIEQVLKLILFVQYRLLSLPWTHVASLWKISLAIVDLVTIHLSPLNVFEIMCCILLDSKLRLDLCNLHLLSDKSHDVSCDLLWLSKYIMWCLMWSIPMPDSWCLPFFFGSPTCLLN